MTVAEVSNVGLASVGLGSNFPNIAVDFDSANHGRAEAIVVADAYLLFTGDFIVWRSPNCGNPQKVQRYPAEWADARLAITVPDAVAAEFGHPLPGWITAVPVQNRAVVKSLQLQLGPGESEAIALAGELSAIRVIRDDKKARRIARQLNLPVTGTVALMIQAKQRGLIANLRDVLDQLTAVGFFLTDSLIEAALRQVGE